MKCWFCSSKKMIRLQSVNGYFCSDCDVNYYVSDNSVIYYSMSHLLNYHASDSIIFNCYPPLNETVIYLPYRIKHGTIKVNKLFSPEEMKKKVKTIKVFL